MSGQSGSLGKQDLTVISKSIVIHLVPSQPFGHRGIPPEKSVQKLLGSSNVNCSVCELFIDCSKLLGKCVVPGLGLILYSKIDLAQKLFSGVKLSGGLGDSVFKLKIAGMLN